MKTLLLLLLTALTAAAAPSERKPSVPESMALSLGVPPGPNYHVDLAGQTLRYRKATGDKATFETINPTGEQWATFQDTLEELHAWEWKKDYAVPPIKYGTQWSVTIALRGRKIESSGSNAYPPDFEKFLDAVRALLGGLEFR